AARAARADVGARRSRRRRPCRCARPPVAASCSPRRDLTDRGRQLDQRVQRRYRRTDHKAQEERGVRKPLIVMGALTAALLAGPIALPMGAAAALPKVTDIATPSVGPFPAVSGFGSTLRGD